MPTSNAVDKGGKIFVNGRLQLIFWGEGWKDTANHKPSIYEVNNALHSLCHGPFFTHLYQYRKIRSPQFLTPVFNTVTVITTSITNAQFEQCIEDSITQLDARDFRQDPNVFYVVIPSNGHDPVGGSAFHSRFTWGTAIGYYAVIPGTASTTGPGGALGVHTVNALKKIVGLLTSPDNGFDTPGFVYNTHTVVPLPGFDELSDLAGSTPTTTQSGYQALGYESNEDDGLIVPNSSPVVLPAADQGTDTFGIKKLYADDTTKTAQNWTMGASNLTSDSRLRVDGSVTVIGGGEYEGHVTSSDNPASFRINVNTTNPLAMDVNEQSKIGTDWSKLEARGYMVGPEDFRNVEMTIYWKVISWSDDDEMSLYCRGGRHGSGWPEGCIGMCYKGQIQRAGNSRWAKEYHHHSGSTGYAFMSGHNTSNLSARNNVWTGQKVVVFDKTVNGKKIVHMEVWKDEAGDSNPASQNWVKINELEDDGVNIDDCSDKGYVSNCHARAKQNFMWGGPTATFRIDNVVVRIKKASVRNILPEGSTPAPGPQPCPTGQHFDQALGQCVPDDNNPNPPPPGPEPGPGDPVPYIKFFLSGGASNSNPFQSIGGAISTTPVNNDTFDNLWDDISAAVQRTGKKSLRVLYVKNTDPTLTLPDTKAYFNTVDQFTKISLGATAKNTTETGVVVETDEKKSFFPLIINNLDVSDGQKLDNTTTRISDHFTATTISAIGKKITRFTIFAKKTGTPTGTISVSLRDSANNVKMTFPNTFSVSTNIPTGTGYTTLVFLNESNTTISVANGDRLSVEYPNGTATNYVEIAINKHVETQGIELQKWNGTIWQSVGADTTSLVQNPTGAIVPNATRLTSPGLFIDKAGGKVLSSARIVVIYWGANSHRTDFDKKVKAMVEAPYLSKLKQYASIQMPTYFGSFVNTTTSTKSVFNGNDVVNMINDTINRNPTIKPTSSGQNTTPFYYCVIPNGKMEMEEFDPDPAWQGGYHSFANTSNGRIWFFTLGAYDEVPLHLDYVFAGFSHELYEGIVDAEYPTAIVAPDPGFLSGYTEIGDICAGGIANPLPNPVGHPYSLGVYADYLTFNGITFLAAEYYSNIDGQCVLPTVVWNPGDPTQPPPSGHFTTAIAGILEEGSSLGQPTPTGLMFYNGGTFFTQCKVHLIFWGSKWPTQSNPSQAQIISAAQNMMNGPYFSALSQYSGIQKPTYSGATNLTSTFNEANIPDELDRMVSAKTVPDYKDDPNVLYFFIPTKDHNAVDNGDAGGYHTADGTSFDGGVTFKPFSYAVGAAPTIDYFGFMFSHEVTETMTNNLQGFVLGPPHDKDGWVANSHCQIGLPRYDEIGDICDYDSPSGCNVGTFEELASNVNGVTVQGYWSNFNAGCVAPTTEQNYSKPFAKLLDFVPKGGSINPVKMDNNCTKLGEHTWAVSSPIYNQDIARVEVYVRKVGSPIGNLICSIVAAGRQPHEGGLLIEGHYTTQLTFSPTAGVDVSTLSAGTFTKITFDKVTTDEYEPQDGDAILFTYADGTSTSYIELALSDIVFPITSGGSGVVAGLNLEFFNPNGTTWDNYSPDGTNLYNLAFNAYVSDSICFGSGTSGSGPVGVVFKQPTKYEEGLPIGSLNPNDYKSIILQRDVPAGAATKEDEAVELIVGAGGTAPAPPPDPGPDPNPNPNPNPPPVGSCTTPIYPGTGQTMKAVDSGATTRHYASDGSSPTTEFEVNNCPFENYEMTIYCNIPSDELTMKMWGPTHSDSNRAWHLCVISSGGSCSMGFEDPHPTTNKNCLQGPSIGSVGSKIIGAKSVIWKLPTGGAHVELWTDTDGKWTKRMSEDKPCGKTYTKSSNQQVQFRCDARPVTINCANVIEIKPNPSPVTASIFPYPGSVDTTNLSPTSTAGTNAVQSESNEEDDTHS